METRANGGRVKFTCSTKDIAGAVGAASKVVNAHTTVPILSNVLLTRRRRSDPGPGDRSRTDAGARRFRRRSPKPAASRSRPNSSAGIWAICRPGCWSSAGRRRARASRAAARTMIFTRLPPDEYPPLPSAQRGTSFAIDAKRFREGVERDDLRGLERRGARRGPDGDAARDRGRLADDGRDRRLPPREVRDGRSRAGLGEAAPVKYIVPSRALVEAARNLGGAEQVEISALGPAANQLSFTVRRRRSSCVSSTGSTRTTGR